ncbi:Chloroplast protein HCF243 [Zea mays]|uniref:Chloroplast protein HCF243 n=1 Tax=Zea mays TaxID=4577 RepID=K7VIW7_MAIZE|nr:Chloroplast protein HCF243 [Zea mays]
MRRKKHLDRVGGGGGGGTELFICFTSRSSAASATSVAGVSAHSSLRPSSSSKLLSPGRGSASASGAEAVPAPPLHPSLSRRLRNSGSLKGGQSPMFPSGSTGGGRRGRGGFEPAEPSSPKVTCIGQVRVKGGKRKPKHASAAALRSRSRRGGGGSAEASFRRAGDDREGPQGKNQGWVHQIPVNICEALKTFGSCGGRSLCSSSRPGEAGEWGALSTDAHRGKKRGQRAPAGGSWLCGAAVARCLLAIQEEEDDDEVGKGAAVVPAEEMRASDGWDVEEEKTVMVGEVEVEKKDEILVVGKEEEGRVSVCIPPRNALLLMRCRSDPVRMAALATRFCGSPAAATVEQVDNEVSGCLNDNEEEGKEEAGAEAEPVECKDEAHGSVVSVTDLKCEECGCDENGGAETDEIDQAKTEAEESSKCGDLMEEKEDASCRDLVGVEEAQIVRKNAGLEVSLGEVTETENQGLDMVVSEEEVPAQEEVEDKMKGRRSISSYSPSAALKEDRTKLRRWSSRRRGNTSSRASSSSDRVGRRHSFSAETEARRSSFSSFKDSRRASFTIDRDGRRWSFSIEQEHLVAEPKVLMASRKGKKTSSEPESEKDCVVVAPNSVEEGQESCDDGKEEETTENAEGEGKTHYSEINQEVEKVETRAEECEGGAGPVIQRRKKSGELPDCLMLMMYEPKLSMEVSKETWVCSTDFVHWKSYQGKNNYNHRQQKAFATGTVETVKKENADGSTVVKDVQESKDPSTVNSAVPMPCPVVQNTLALKPATTEQTPKLELPPVTNAAAYAPFVLKRCKSEPMRSSARLAPDACFWKDRHLPLNATGVGF